MKKLFISILFAALAGVASAQSSLKLPSLSPTTKIVQDFSLSSIEINYSRPSMRGRMVFGDVVAWGRPWRTGANGPTKIKFGEDVEILGSKIKAGEYVLYTIPNKDKWEVIFNTGATPLTASGYDKINDVARFTIEPTPIPNNCQTFTIDIADITYNTCRIELIWEKTKISIPVIAHNEETAGKNIDKAINHATIPYQQAASYLFEANGDINKAEELVNKALEQDPKSYSAWYLKARIEMKLGKKKEAKEAAEKSLETAAGSALEEDFKHNNQKILDELKHK
jgi:Protein of unknown function (DUF2911)/Tetratricopeptide repeat